MNELPEESDKRNYKKPEKNISNKPSCRKYKNIQK